MIGARASSWHMETKIIPIRRSYLIQEYLYATRVKAHPAECVHKRHLLHCLVPDDYLSIMLCCKNARFCGHLHISLNPVRLYTQYPLGGRVIGIDVDDVVVWALDGYY